MNNSVIQSPQPKPVKRWSSMALKLVMRDIGSWLIFFAVLAVCGLIRAAIIYSDIEAQPGIAGDVSGVIGMIINALMASAVGYMGVNAAQRADLGYGAKSDTQAFTMGFKDLIPIMAFALPIFLILEFFVFGPSMVNETQFFPLWLESNIFMGLNIVLHVFLKGFLAIPSALCVGMSEKEVDGVDKEFKVKEPKLRFFLTFIFIILLYFLTMVALVLNPILATIICLVGFPWMSSFVYVAGREMIGGISENKTVAETKTVASPAMG